MMQVPSITLCAVLTSLQKTTAPQAMCEDLPTRGSFGLTFANPFRRVCILIMKNIYFQVRGDAWWERCGEGCCEWGGESEGERDIEGGAEREL